MGGGGWGGVGYFLTVIYNEQVNLLTEHRQCIFQTHIYKDKALTLKVLVTTIDAQWGDGGYSVGEVRASTTSPCPTIRVLSYSN